MHLGRSSACLTSTTMSPPFIQQRSHFNDCIEGWLEDQSEQEQFEAASALPSVIQRVMCDSPTQSWAARPLDRPGSPSKRQRTSETKSSSQWAERISRLDSDSGLSTFTEPTPSGTSASRAPSPTKSVRSRRVQLDYTSPAICFGPPGQFYHSEEEMSDNGDSELHNTQQSAPTIYQQARNLSLEHADVTSSTNIDAGLPLMISALIRRFSEEAADPVLPPGIISHIMRISPTEFFREPVADQISQSKTPAITPSKLLRHISKLYEMARELYAGSYDEAAWYPLIRTILIGPPGTSSNPFIKHEEAHTRVVCSDLLPQQNNKPIPTVKIDHLLQFNPGHRLISPLYRPVFQLQPAPFSLSAFSDPVAAKTFTCAVIEVKAPGGNFQEASYQVAVASAAILQRIKLLGDDSDDDNYMPVVGWVVHGHFWTLQISYREIDGSIRVLGPYPSGNTATYLGLYRLLRIIDKVKLWGKGTYFPYLSAKLSQWQ